MKNANSLYTLKEKLSNKVLRTSRENLYKIHQDCVNEKKFTYDEIASVTSGVTSIDDLSEQQLYWFLEISRKYIKGLGEANEYFTEVEILGNKFYESDTEETIKFPLVFDNCMCLTPKSVDDKKQFGFYLSVKDITKYKANGVFQVVPELQRGGKIDRYGDLKTIVNPARRKEITDLIESGNFFYNSISICLIEDEDSDWEFDNKKNKLIIHNGTLIIADGNHRAIACEFVQDSNIHSTDIFHILFTVGIPEEIKRKISQEWNTEPVNKTHRRAMERTAANKIVDSIKKRSDIDELIRKNIVTTVLQSKNGEGFIVYSILSDAIEKYYDTKSMTTREEQNEIVSWLVEFLNYLIYLFKEDFLNYKKLKDIKWNIKPYAFAGYIMLSSYYQNTDNWKEKTKKTLEGIEFKNVEEFKKNKKESAIIRYVEDIFKERIDNAENKK